MMSMNCRPPRAIDTARPARLPAVKARMRNRLSWNIGWGILVSTNPNTISRAMPPTSPASTCGFVQPIVCPP